ncbi:MAG: rod shape-determining protein RodA, partial [Novosphingobium sp.]
MPRAYVPAAIARQPWSVLLPLIALVSFGAAVLDSAAGGRFEIWSMSHLFRFGVFLVMAMIIARLPKELFSKLAIPVYAGLCFLLVLVELIGGMG